MQDNSTITHIYPSYLADWDQFMEVCKTKLCVAVNCLAQHMWLFSSLGTLRLRSIVCGAIV